MADEEKAIAAAYGLSQLFGRTLSKDGNKLFARALRDVPDEALALGADAVLKSNREFMPTPGQFRMICLLNGETPRCRSLSAWAVALNATRYGSRQSVQFQDGLIGSTIRSLGGWAKFVDRCKSEEQTWARKEFLETYEASIGAEVADEPALKGTDALEQSEWTRQTYGEPPTMMIASPYQTAERLGIAGAAVPKIEFKRA